MQLLKFSYPVLCIGFISVFISSCNTESKTPATLQQKVAEAYGLDNFDKVKSIAFTFNINKDTIAAARNWVWDVKNDVVSFMKDSENITYRRDTITSDAMKKIDGMFTNDQYWLLFPYHLAWDSSMNVTIKENQPSPINKTALTMITAKYMGKEGYTPGDSYDLYVDSSHMIREWMFHKGGAAEPTIVTTWSEPVSMGGLKISTEHSNADSSFRIFFTGVKVD